MAYTPPDFQTTAVIVGSTPIRLTDEQLRILMADVRTFSQNVANGLSEYYANEFQIFKTNLETQITNRLNEILTVQPDSTYYTAAAIDTRFNNRDVSISKSFKQSGWLEIPHLKRQPYPSELFERTNTANTVRFKGWWYNFSGIVKFIDAQNIVLPAAPDVVLNESGVVTVNRGNYVVIDSKILSSTGSNTYTQNKFYTYTGGGIGGALGHVYKLIANTFTADISTVDFSNTTNFEDFGNSSIFQCILNSINKKLNNETYFRSVKYVSNQDAFSFYYDKNTNSLGVKVETDYIQMQHKVDSEYTNDEIAINRGYFKGKNELLGTFDNWTLSSGSEIRDNALAIVRESGEENNFINMSVPNGKYVIQAKTILVYGSYVRISYGDNNLNNFTDSNEIYEEIEVTTGILKLNITVSVDSKGEVLPISIKRKENIENGIYTKDNDNRSYSHLIVRQTLNQGVYNPFWNERGTAQTRFSNGNGSTAWYASIAINVENTHDAFVVGHRGYSNNNDTVSPPDSRGGNIGGGGTAGRQFEDRYYDVVYLSQMFFRPACSNGHNLKWEKDIINNVWEWGVEGLVETKSSTESAESSILYRNNIPHIDRVGALANSPQSLKNALASGSVYGIKYHKEGQDGTSYLVESANKVILSKKAVDYLQSLKYESTGISTSSVLLESKISNKTQLTLTQMNINTVTHFLFYERKSSIYNKFKSVGIQNNNSRMFASNSFSLNKGALLLEPLGVPSGTGKIESKYLEDIDISYDFKSSDGVQTVIVGQSILCVEGFAGTDSRAQIGAVYQRLNSNFTADLNSIAYADDPSVNMKLLGYTELSPKHSTVKLDSTGFIAGKAMFMDAIVDSDIVGQVIINEIRYNVDSGDTGEFVLTNGTFTDDNGNATMRSIIRNISLNE